MPSGLRLELGSHGLSEAIHDVGPLPHDDAVTERAQLAQHADVRRDLQRRSRLGRRHRHVEIHLHEAIDGGIASVGTDAQALRGLDEIFYRMGRFLEFDACEFSLSTYTIRRGRGEPMIAIPVFPSQMFRHSSIFIGDKAGIREPKDLRGKRVGVPKYHMTAAVWI